MLNQNIVREATRLTRAGQLVEATALLQRMLRGEFDPGPASRSAAPTRAREARAADHRRKGQRRRGEGKEAARAGFLRSSDANAPRGSTA